MIKNIFNELKVHAPFTFMGALSGILIFFVLKNIPHSVSFKLFYTFHPLHVFLSAYVTAAIYKLHAKDTHWFKVLLVGFVGSIGVATLSDSIFPFLGETLLKLPQREMHIGFLEKWYIIDPIAIFGVFMGMKIPTSKFPHMAHVFVSTWASLFHIMMAATGAIIPSLYLPVLFILFVSVWVPCCFSDIVFPLFFTKGEVCPCGCCELHKK